MNDFPPASQLLDGDLMDRVRRLEIFSRFRVEGVLDGFYKSPFKGYSTDFLQHRQYHLGDNLSRLDWRLYGRSEKLFVREFEEHTTGRLSVLLDVSGSMGFQGESMSKHDFAVRTAAVLCFLAYVHRDSFALAAFRTDRVAQIPFGTGQRHLWRVFGALLDLQAAGGTDFTRSLDTSMGAIRRKGLTVMLSDFMDDPETIIKRLAYLRLRGSDVVAMQVYDPAERELDFSTVTRFHDPEGDETVVVDAPLIRRQYREAFANHIVAVKNACRRHGFEHVELPVGDEFEVPLLEFVRWRMEQFS